MQVWAGRPDSDEGMWGAGPSWMKMWSSPGHLQRRPPNVSIPMRTIVDLFFLPPMDPAHERWMVSTWGVRFVTKCYLYDAREDIGIRTPGRQIYTRIQAEDALPFTHRLHIINVAHWWFHLWSFHSGRILWECGGGRCQSSVASKEGIYCVWIWSVR